MTPARVPVVCAGCGALVDAAASLPFRCPNAALHPAVDHVLTPQAETLAFGGGPHRNPFLRYRQWTLAGRLASACGLSDDAFAGLVGELDRGLERVDGRALVVTPFAEQPALARALRVAGLRLWVKDETGNVAGSHKVRHLAAVMLYLCVLEAARLPLAEGLRDRTLAVASCGNAALAAAVVARAAERKLAVFIPPDAEPSVVARLRELGAAIEVCPRMPGVAGDPCVQAFRAAVAAGALPFAVLGPDNGVAVEGARTLAYEMAEALADSGEALDDVFVQVGGGALASGMGHGFAEMAELGVLASAPALFAVQAEGCCPLRLAHDRLGSWMRAKGATPSGALAYAASHRSAFMRPVEQTPHSVADGILDDEAYDWLAVLEAMLRTRGGPVVVDEATLKRAHAAARAHTAISASPTGTAGLAGVLAARPRGRRVAVVFTGVER
jgi:threonine synthase